MKKEESVPALPVKTNTVIHIDKVLYPPVQ